MGAGTAALAATEAVQEMRMGEVRAAGVRAGGATALVAWVRGAAGC